MSATTEERLMLVQWCMSAQFFSEAALQQTVERIYQEGAPEQQQIIDLLNSKLTPFSLELRSSLEQTTGERWWAMVSTSADAISRGASNFTAMELGALRHLVGLVFTSEDGNYVVGLHTVLRAIADQASASFSRRDAQELLDRFCAEGWLNVAEGGVTVGQRAMIELPPYLTEQYGDFMRSCCLCQQMATCGLACDSCGQFIHPCCADRLTTSGAELPSCPACLTQMTSPGHFGPGKPGVAHTVVKEDDNSPPGVLDEE